MKYLTKVFDSYKLKTKIFSFDFLHCKLWTSYQLYAKYMSQYSQHNEHSVNLLE